MTTIRSQPAQQDSQPRQRSTRTDTPMGSRRALRAELLKLSVAERLRLAQELWESIAADCAGFAHG